MTIIEQKTIVALLGITLGASLYRREVISILWAALLLQWVLK